MGIVGAELLRGQFGGGVGGDGLVETHVFAEGNGFEDPVDRGTGG